MLWDGDDRLRQVNDHATSSLFFSALYDGDGVRVKKTDTRGALGLQVNDFSYGPQGLLWSSNPNTVHTPGFGHRSNGINTFYHHDWLGSTRYTSDATGNTFPQALRFDAFGNRTATGGTAAYHSTDLQWAGAFGYQTEWASATDPGLGLQYLEQRYYDPAVGRFISPDPIGLAGGLNLYGYSRNNPVGAVDPGGLAPWYDEWHDYLAGVLERGQAQVNGAYATNGLGIGLATAINTGGELALGVFDLPANVVHLPEAIGRWGQGTHRFFADPTLENVSGLGQDILLPASLYFGVRGAAGGLAKFAGAIESRSPGFWSRCRVGSVPGLGSLIDEWGSGSFPSAEESAIDHYERHGGQRGVSAKNLPDYLRKAIRARDAALKSGRTGKPVPGHTPDVQRFPGDNDLTYIDIQVSSGKIISYGAR